MSETGKPPFPGSSDVVLTAGPRPLRCLFLALGGLFLVVFGAALLSIAVEVARGGHGVPMLVMGAVGTYFLVLGLSTVWLTADLLFLPRPLIVVGPEGLTDRRLSPVPIPWDRLSWRQAWFLGALGGAVQLDTDVPLAPRPPQRLLAVLNRLCRYPAWNVITGGTGLRADELARAMERFAAPAPRR